MSKAIKVLIVDDSALVRKYLSDVIGSDPLFEVVGAAPDPFVAREKIKKLNPDVLTLDIEMPRMDGITFLKNLMRLRPMPVVIVSSLATKGADVTLEALELGAVDFVRKPAEGVSGDLAEYCDELLSKLKSAAAANVYSYKSVKVTNSNPRNTEYLDKSTTSKSNNCEALIAIGSSTGGTEAIKIVIKDLPPTTPGIVITQHIPGSFSAAFAKRLDGLSYMCVCEASEGQEILTGHVYIAPGDQHLLVVRKGNKYFCKLDSGSPVNRHKPSVDVLFKSVVQAVGSHAIGIILTGMGSDGAKGLKELQEANAITIAQDEKTSIVWGMPGSAVKIGAANEVLPLHKVANAILDLTSEKSEVLLKNGTTER